MSKATKQDVVSVRSASKQEGAICLWPAEVGVYSNGAGSQARRTARVSAYRISEPLSDDDFDPITDLATTGWQAGTPDANRLSDVAKVANTGRAVPADALHAGRH